MKNDLFLEIKQRIDSSIAPGCSLVILSKGNKNIDYSFGTFLGDNSSQITPDTLYDIASITKLYTTSIILRLYEQGKIDIYDRCSVYLPIFEKSELTIVDLLTHRANFGIRLSEYRSKYQTFFKTKIFEIIPPVKPSQEAHYENITFLYLGKIIEQITSKSLKEVFMELFNELGLKNTALGLKSQTIFNSPPTEIRNNYIVQNTTHDESAALMGGMAGNAGVFASAADLAKFGNLWIDDGKIMSKKKLYSIVFKDYSERGDRSQALGWHQDLFGMSYKNKNIYLHTGYTGCLLAININSSVICSFVCNRTYFGRDNIKYRKILKLLTDYLI
ncbi:MAG: serine hydrolase domain-containing protein [Patescibacteria group bacterium]|nr:serine hydrolase domain-containing protein [Patescibacteria group bacterium]